MVNDEVRSLAAEWRRAREELTAVAIPPEYPINRDAFQKAYDAEQAAERAYYRLLRERFGWNPPHGVTLDE